MPEARKDWRAPRSPGDLSRPEVLNAIELLQAEIYLSQDASLAMPVFERLWSRRDHPDMIDSSGQILAQAAQLLQVAGHKDFARRMYVAAANTKYLDVLASTSSDYADRHVLTDGLKKMGFADDAAAVDKLFRISETVHGQKALQDLGRQVDERMRAAADNWQETLVRQARGYALAYKHYGNPRLAASYGRYADIWQASIDERASQAAAFEQQRRVQASQQASRAQEDSGFLGFVNVLSAGLQAYAGARQGGGAAAGNRAAVTAASRAHQQSNPDQVVTGALLAAAAGTAQGTQTVSRPAAVTSSSTAARPAAAPKKTYRDAGDCVMRDRTSNSLTDFLGNRCNFKINVRWVTLDDGPCRVGRMCGDSLAANRQRSSVTKAKGSVIHAACEAPARVVNPDGSPWRGGESYRCHY